MLEGGRDPESTFPEEFAEPQSQPVGKHQGAHPDATHQTPMLVDFGPAGTSERKSNSKPMRKPKNQHHSQKLSQAYLKQSSGWWY